MRYRPFAAAGASVSALTLTLGRGAARGRSVAGLVKAGIDAGVNAFELPAGDPALLSEAGEALGGIDRQLLLVSLQLGAPRRRAEDTPADFRPETVDAAVEQALAQTGLNRFDIVSLAHPKREDVTPELTGVFDRLRREGRVRSFGVAGDGPDIEPLIRSRTFKVLATRFNLLSGWPERNRIRLAGEHGMTVVGYGYWGAELRRTDAAGPVPERRRGLLHRMGLKRNAPVQLAKDRGYGFLDHTSGWTGEEIALAYALTEPALASVQVSPASADALAKLARTPERELPAGLAAQIEMARFAALD